MTGKAGQLGRNRFFLCHIIYRLVANGHKKNRYKGESLVIRSLLRSVERHTREFLSSKSDYKSIITLELSSPR